MVASVQELILAANAKRDESPLVSIAKALASGYDSYRTSKSAALDDLVKKSTIQSNQRDMLGQAQMGVDINNFLNSQKDAETKQALNQAGVKPSPAMPSQKLQMEITQNEKGRYGRTWKMVEPKKATLEDRILEMVDSGKLSLEQAYAMKNRSGGGVQTPPSGYRFKADGTLEKIPGGPAEDKQTESQANSRLFGTRADEANGQINQLLDSQSYDPASLSSTKNNLPNWMGGNLIRSKEAQLYEQAKTNFLTAVLRKESGATIQPSEFETGNAQYFPMVGDSPEVIAQKRQNRETAIRLIQSAGGIKNETIPANPTSMNNSGGWDNSKEERYQELLRKRGGK